MRPDIAFAVNKGCQFMACASDAHWVAVKCILRYLKGTLFCGLQFQSSSSLDLHGYSDASCLDDQRSTNRYCIFLGSNIISLSSSKQRLVFKSSVESEYRSLVALSAELVWIQTILKELCLRIASPTIWCDNQSAAYLAHCFSLRAKHIEIDLHLIWEKVLCNELVIKYVPSLDQIADILTKHLSKTHKLSVISSPMSLRGDYNHLTSSQTSHNRSTNQTVWCSVTFLYSNSFS